MTTNLSLGQKIRYYRKQADLAQIDLEIRIDAAPGSISRIEHDKVKPKKETLSKIAKVLHLSANEITNLLGFEVLTYESIVQAINTISKSLDIDTTLQVSVDVMFGLLPNYNGGVIFLIDEEVPDRVFSKTVSNMPNMPQALSLLSKKVSQLNVSLIHHQNNLMVKTINLNKNFQSFDLYDFTSGAINKTISQKISQILNFQSGISLPIRYSNEIIGSAFYTKKIKEYFDQEEEKILELFTNQLAIAIRNAKLITQINQNIRNLETQINQLIY